MPPAPVTKASRRSRHVIESSSESSATPPILARPTRATKAAKSYAEDDEDDDVEDEDDGPQEKDVDREGEKDAEGEDEDGEDEGGVEKDMEIDGLESEEEAGYKLQAHTPALVASPEKKQQKPLSRPSRSTVTSGQASNPKSTPPSRTQTEPKPSRTTTTTTNSTSASSSTTTPVSAAVPKIKLKFGSNVKSSPVTAAAATATVAQGSSSRGGRVGERKKARDSSGGRAAGGTAGRKGKKVKRDVDYDSDEAAAAQMDDMFPDDGLEPDNQDDDEDEEDEDDDFDFDGDDTSKRSISPSKLTARQRSKLDGLGEGLMELPETQGKNKLILTETEKMERKEEIARRRKRQSEQKLQDEQDQTINRLLRAQTGRSRAKLDDDPIPGSGSGTVTPGQPSTSSLLSRSRSSHPTLPEPGMIRYTSRLTGDMTRNTLTVPADFGALFSTSIPVNDGGDSGRDGDKKTGSIRRVGMCAVQGCSNVRKYRLVNRFEIGACGMEHLKLLEKSGS